MVPYFRVKCQTNAVFLLKVEEQETFHDGFHDEFM